MLIDKLLRTAISTALIGRITHNAKEVPLFHKVPDGQRKPFIEIIGQNTLTDGGNKDKRGFTSNVPIRICTTATGGAGGDLEADEIEQMVIDLLDEQISITGYQIVREEYTSQTFNQQFGAEYQTHKILNFYYTIIKQ
jgi:hypothetical protein